MPSWGIHFKIADAVSKKIPNLNQNQFMFGNILPDINNGYVVKGISKTIEHNITHCDKIKDSKNYEVFYNKYRNEIDNSIVKGYLTHLLTDFYFNDLTYSKRGIHDELGKLIGIKLNSGENKLCSQEDARKIKTNDFKIFANYIYQNKNLEKIGYDKEILSSTDIIKEINIVEEDLFKTIEYINSHIEGKENILKESDNKDYKIFDENQLIKHSDLCVDFIIKYLDEKR